MSVSGGGHKTHKQRTQNGVPCAKICKMKKYEFERGTNRGAKGVTEIRMNLPQDVRKWIDRAKSENAHKPRGERPTKPHICEALVGEALEAIGLGARPTFTHVAGIRKRNGKRLDLQPRYHARNPHGHQYLRNQHLLL